jgi:predicted ATPase
MKNKLIVITGCSGGGKSTLTDTLNKMGYTTMPEAGRIIVKDQLTNNGDNLPWTNEMGFCNLLIEKSLVFYKNALLINNAKDNIVFFDRSFLDAVSYYQAHTEKDVDSYNALIEQFKFSNPVFMTPPWKEIFSEDAERKHSYEAAVSEYDRLKQFYPKHGYTVIDIPPSSIEKRIEFIFSLI